MMLRRRFIRGIFLEGIDMNNVNSLPITERLADEELSLPIGPAIKLEEVATVVDLINRF